MVDGGEKSPPFSFQARVEYYALTDIKAS